MTEKKTRPADAGREAQAERPRAVSEPETVSASASGPNLEEARLRQQAIGVRLRRLFDDVVNEPVPESFFDILRQGDASGGGDA